MRWNKGSEEARGLLSLDTWCCMETGVNEIGACLHWALDFESHWDLDFKTHSVSVSVASAFMALVSVSFCISLTFVILRILCLMDWNMFLNAYVTNLSGKVDSMMQWSCLKVWMCLVILSLFLHRFSLSFTIWLSWINWANKGQHSCFHVVSLMHGKPIALTRASRPEVLFAWSAATSTPFSRRRVRVLVIMVMLVERWACKEVSDMFTVEVDHEAREEGRKKKASGDELELRWMLNVLLV